VTDTALPPAPTVVVVDPGVGLKPPAAVALSPSIVSLSFSNGLDNTCVVGLYPNPGGVSVGNRDRNAGATVIWNRPSDGSL
jgi:hypothetical protein